MWTDSMITSSFRKRWQTCLDFQSSRESCNVLPVQPSIGVLCWNTTLKFIYALGVPNFGTSGAHESSGWPKSWPIFFRRFSDISFISSWKCLFEIDPSIVWTLTYSKFLAVKSWRVATHFAQLYSLGMQVPLKRYAVYGVIYWIATCHQKVKIRAAVSCQAHHLPLPQIACFATYFELREQSLRAMTQLKELNKFVLQVSFVIKSHQLHEVVWNIAQKLN